MPRQAAVFLAHIASPRITYHFLRLKAETRGLLGSYLCIHNGANYSRAGNHIADFGVSSCDEEKTLPIRFVEKVRQCGTITPSFSDLAYMPALLPRRLLEYDNVLMVEYHVDFAGHWRELFRPVVSSRADFIGSTLCPRADCPGWDHWKWFEPPDAVSKRHYIRSFNPIVRISWRTQIQAERWTQAREHDLGRLSRFAKVAGAGEMLNIHDLKAAYETAVGHATSNSTVYNLLARAPSWFIDAARSVRTLSRKAKQLSSHDESAMVKLERYESSHDTPRRRL